MALVASYIAKVTVRPAEAATPDDQAVKPLTIAQVTEAIEEAVRRVYWDQEDPGGQSVEVHATAERTDV